MTLRAGTPRVPTVPQRFFIIDGLAQIFRCYYAPFRQLTAPSGEPVRATYVFCNMLLQIIREHRPDYLAMALDPADGKVFREEIDPQYKANREPPPEDLIPQIRRIIDIVRAAGIPVLGKPGFEADDVMATICRKLAGADVQVCLVSRDKDLDQLLSDRVYLYDAGKGEFLGPADLQAAKGYSPAQAVDIQTLTGDSTDNVPGVVGIGPKKAAALIAKYGSADAVIAHADQLTPAMKKNVLAFADKVDTVRKLVTLRGDLEMDFDIEAMRFRGLNKPALKNIFEELGFRRLVEQMAEPDDTESKGGSSLSAAPPPSECSSEKRPAGGPQAATGIQGSLFDHAPTTAAGSVKPAAERDYVLVDDEKAFRGFLAELRKQQCFAFDTETTHLNPSWSDLVGMSFSWKTGSGHYLPVRGVGKTLPLESTLEALRPILADAKVAKVGQNIKYDLIVMKRHGVDVGGVDFDTMIASFVLDSSRRSHSMNALARELLGYDPIPISDLIGKGANQIRFDQVGTQQAGVYAAEDADATWSLGEVLRGQLADSDLEPLYHETEMPLVEVLVSMESEGVKLDTTFLKQMSRDLDARLRKLTEDIHHAVGHPFNIDSTKQLADVLFNELKLPVIRKTKTGRSTDAETLEQLALDTDHPVPKLIREYRELIKLKNTYVDTLPEMICPRTGRVHASFNQTVAVTGRLSSSDPNLQNIPIRTELGRQIRKAFVARDADHVLLTADYSQIELRVLAHFCKDDTLLEAFRQDRDIHQFVASQVFGVPLEDVTREQRGKAKAVNFGIIYGQTAYGLSRGTSMSVTEAQDFIDKYFQRYPGIRRFIDQAIAGARRNGFVKTILGRRRAIADINSRNTNARAAAERLAINTVIQGSAADLIKRAMIQIFRRIRKENRPTHLLIQVHDELVFDVPRAAVQAEAEIIRHEMCTALPLEVPIRVDLAWGDNWLEGK